MQNSINQNNLMRNDGNSYLYDTISNQNHGNISRRNPQDDLYAEEKQSIESLIRFLSELEFSLIYLNN